MSIKTPAGIYIDATKIKNHLTNFIREQLEKAGYSRLVIGISGGLDSAVVAYLSANAIGANNVTGVILPYSSTGPENVEDAELLIERLALNRRYVDITPMVDAYFAACPTADKNRKGNKMARERMSILYDISAAIGALVIGTSNKSEIKMGYGTLHGNLACALNPLGNLYKTQVRQLAKYLGVPDKIIAKPPSADLWAGQTDEGELGLTYDTLDAFLYYYDDLSYNNRQLQESGFSEDFIKAVTAKIAQNKFKGRMPALAELPK